MKNIAVFGATLTGNKGAEAMFTSVNQNLPKYIQVNKFYLFSYYPISDEKIIHPDNVEIVNGTPLFVITLFPIVSLFFRLFPFFLKGKKFENKTINALLNTDIFIDVAGVSFVDGRGKYLPFNIGCILPALILGKPVFKLSQAMGPFKNPINRILAKEFLNRMTGIVSRGPSTSKHLLEIGMNSFIEAPDLAFSIEIKTDEAIIKSYLSDEYLSKPIFGICPSAEVWLRCNNNGINYSHVIADFINYLQKYRDVNVILIPHSIRKYTSKLKNNDLPICKDIMEMVEDKGRCILISDELSYVEIRQIISVSKYFLASRFHAMISALSVKTPVIVCGWSHKYAEVLSQFGIEKFALDYSDINLERLIQSYDSLINEEIEIIRKINEKTRDISIASLKNFQMIKNWSEF